ncbi:hypothetical protein [Nonomuraea polychroma]|uniref:hypothetical protein n=1 Tax=Nonomuraea polychroma TaxID=46176 RepID=UPI000FDF5709|nr:hypothetical protein [Nonomuraea polychroma]
MNGVGGEIEQALGLLKETLGFLPELLAYGVCPTDVVGLSVRELPRDVICDVRAGGTVCLG